MAEQFIAGIQEYCDRWCEKCALTARCRTADRERREALGLRDPEREIMENLQSVFADATNRLGIQWQPPVFDPDENVDEDQNDDPFRAAEKEFERTRRFEKAFIETHETTILARRYVEAARDVLETPGDWLDRVDANRRAEPLRVLRWYLYFMSTKTTRALRSLVDYGGEILQSDIDDPQSDTNGSFKIALIAAENSIRAWQMLAAPGNEEFVGRFVELLETYIERTEDAFPHAREFVRPGFDEIENAS